VAPEGQGVRYGNVPGYRRGDVPSAAVEIEVVERFSCGSQGGRSRYRPTVGTRRERHPSDELDVARRGHIGGHRQCARIAGAVNDGACGVDVYRAVRRSCHEVGGVRCHWVCARVGGGVV
jgi:hypothetical protein